LNWLQDEAGQPTERCDSILMLNEDEMRVNSERATEKIMDVFNDPIFQQGDRAMELEEIDF
jgi:hypothetical protein